MALNTSVQAVGSEARSLRLHAGNGSTIYRNRMIVLSRVIYITRFVRRGTKIGLGSLDFTPMRDMGCGMRDAGFWIRDSGYIAVVTWIEGVL